MGLILGVILLFAVVVLIGRVLMDGIVAGAWGVVFGVIGVVLALAALVSGLSSAGGCDSIHNRYSYECTRERQELGAAVRQRKASEEKALERAMNSVIGSQGDVSKERRIRKEMEALYKRGKCEGDIAECMADIRRLAEQAIR